MSELAERRRRSDARERALNLLYEAESKGISPGDALERADRRARRADGAARRAASPSTASASTRRSPPRRQGLDVGAHAGARPQRDAPRRFELVERPDVPVAVVLDEAVELAKRFSTDDSGRFVNGVLSALVPSCARPRTTDAA